MDKDKIKNVVAGFGIASLVAGVALPTQVQGASG
ncbi:MAG: SbtA family thio(seleno)oxazole RiPP natural product precursor [Trichlorobacter sp.]